MTKHAAYPSEDVVAAMAASTPPGQHFTSIPPLKGAPLDCKKHADMDLLRLRGCRRERHLVRVHKGFVAAACG